MSVRIMADGKPYDRTSERQVRPEHKAERCSQSKWLCCANLKLKDGRTVVCRAHVYERKDNRTIRRLVHGPGTFWENDMPRWR
jgi:hypothetical protein